jgi:SHAQKYF class myb-like DNA-binding protein
MFNQYPFYYSLSTRPCWPNNYFSFRHSPYYSSPFRSLHHISSQTPQVITINDDHNNDINHQIVSVPETSKKLTPLAEQLANSKKPKKRAKPESANKEIHPKSLCKVINPGRWTSEEHERFLEGNSFTTSLAIRLYGKNWIKVETYVGTRTRAQIRSHAQKHFNNKKNNASVDPQKKDNLKASASNQCENKVGSKSDSELRCIFLEEFM